jgi:DNA polymerase sigma
MSRYIVKIVESCGISNQEISDRQRIVDQLNFLIASVGLPCHLTLFGSSASGFGFKSSDVNINITMESKNEALPDSNEQAKILSELYRTLQNSPNWK